MPEEFSEIVPEQREIYSSPAFGSKAKIGHKTEQVWFPQVTSANPKKSRIVLPNPVDKNSVKFRVNICRIIGQIWSMWVTFLWLLIL